MAKGLFSPSTIIATFFWVGKIPVISGTMGSLVAFPLWFLIVLLNVIRGYSGLVAGNLDFLNYSLFLIFLLFIIGVWAAGEYEKATHKQDPKEVVIDEVVGQLLVIAISVYLLPDLLAVEMEAFNSHDLNAGKIFDMMLFCNFAFFRLFDITKPWPISIVDKKVKGGFGIMLDDIVAVPFAVLFSFCSVQLICDLIIRFYK